MSHNKNRLKSKQWRWLEKQARSIPLLFESVRSGEREARHDMGERVINGRRVRLSLVAQVSDTGRNPLENHASSLPPIGTSGDREDQD